MGTEFQFESGGCTPRLHTELIRSQSLELCHSPPSPGILTASRSDPTLPIGSRRRHSSGGESYAHRHIRLSMHRLPITSPVVPPGMSIITNHQ